MKKLLILFLLTGLVLYWALGERGMAESESSHTRTTPLPSASEIAQLPPDGGDRFNRLVHETSPYLRQHAANPVDWYPWGEEAFKKAREEGKPIFLSVGYSSCHWCHVMAHESFEDEKVAAILNRHFVPVKVDREERPDVDEQYMLATQLFFRMIGQPRSGGWPNSVWLTPDGKPWYAGTYFPKSQFIQVLNFLAKRWTQDRDLAVAQGTRLAEMIEQSLQLDLGPRRDSLSRTLVEKATDQYRRRFDLRWGGPSGQPKFPPHSTLRLMLYEYNRTENTDLLALITGTLDGMIKGGIHDHVGGGFHRYSTDARWFLPHFEKMLYDNGQLAWVYTEAYRLTGKERYRDAAGGILDWVLREMTDPGGGFYSALDADSEGEEGKYYLWSYDELAELLGTEEVKWFAGIYNATSDGNYREEASGRRAGGNILYLQQPLEALAEREKMKLKPFKKRLAASQEKILEKRLRRIPPGLDDKVLTSWNGLMIAGLAHAGKHLEKPRYTAAAEKAARFILTTMRKDGRLYRTYRDGQSKLTAYLDDYAFLADGLVNLYEATENPEWLDHARELIEVLMENYYDENSGGFFFTPDDHEALMGRSKDPYDSAVPAGNAVAARALIRLSIHLDDPVLKETAGRSLQAYYPYLERSPQGAATFVEALALYLDGEQGTAGATATTEKHPVRLELTLDEASARRGDTIEVALSIAIQEEWHINSHAPLQDYLVATALGLKPVEGLSLTSIQYPKGTLAQLGPFPEKVSIYKGTVNITAQLKVSEKMKPGSQELFFEVRTQACDDKSCLPPETHRLSLTINVVPTD